MTEHGSSDDSVVTEVTGGHLRMDLTLLHSTSFVSLCTPEGGNCTYNSVLANSFHVLCNAF